MPNVEKDYSAFLHIQGKSLQKGTESLLNIWSIHPEWPKLTVLTRFRDSRWHQAQNIEIITDYLTEAEMNRLMNSIGVHICTAETEGFGHSLNEALSTKAVTVTTDAPPMNELVSCEFGILVKYLSVEQRGLSEWFGIDPMDLERKIEIIIRTGETAKTEMGELARSSYLAKDREFRERILGAARDLLF
jgi:hypothetical protein